ncbi:hypothetical protein B0H16DRAFT_285634 [Mycena metata]|uniref:RRM domain-containing protein n=1 Tax=Mycena metata TaxID=1033252 RepID=A0AAD7MNF5_9AGAR|nr:hypothetical protein B0H16DRAFT_285634 [Mycena metata]
MNVPRRCLPFIRPLGRRISSSPRRSSENALEDKKHEARLKTAVNWVHRTLKPTAAIRTVLPTTIYAHQVPRDTPVSELLDLVFFGPLFRVKVRGIGQMRFVSLTFYETDKANAFFREMTDNEVVLRGSRLKFTWGHSRVYRNRRPGTRAIYLHDVQRLGGTHEAIKARMSLYGRVDRVLFTNDDRTAFVDFYTEAYARNAIDELHKEGVKAGFTDDRCYTAGALRAAAVRNRVRQVILSDLPSETSVSELCDHIRGGALEKIVFLPERRVAFVDFLTHEKAIAFSRYAIYHGITLAGQRLSVQMKEDKPHLTALAPHIAASVAHGASRCLRVINTPERTVDAVRRAFERYGAVERVEFQPPATATVAFLSIRDAIAASRLILNQTGYEYAEVEFTPDHCAAPLPSAQNAAQTLRAHINKFLSLHELLQTHDQSQANGWAPEPEPRAEEEFNGEEIQPPEQPFQRGRDLAPHIFRRDWNPT